MSAYYDESEHSPNDQRESRLYGRLSSHLLDSVSIYSGLSAHLSGYDLTKINSASSLSTLPILHKSKIMEAQLSSPPFGNFASFVSGSRVFVSPGPVWEPQTEQWGAARSLYAAGIRKGDIVHNALSHHMTPGGFILDEGIKELGAISFPAGIGNTQQQVEAIHALRPSAYAGTPDYLKTILEKAQELELDVSSINKALVSGGALFPELRQEYKQRGINVLQAYATADCGVIAYESQHEGEIVEGMIVNEDIILEICRVGTGDPVSEGEVGEIVITNFSTTYPLVRFATGDLSAFIPEPSPCGRTNKRIKGWLGRADQRTKVKGMFVDPQQISQLVKEHKGIEQARLVVTRHNDKDTMKLLIVGENIDTSKISESLKHITKLTGEVELVPSLPNDGKVISDERDYDQT